MRTFSPKAGDIQRQWHVIDASDVVLGRLATQAATLLRGKHKPIFAPHMDTGDFVIVINAEKVALSGRKLEQKRAYRHSGYPGGLRSMAYGDLLERHPERVIEKAVRGMLPKNSLGRSHAAQAQGVRRAGPPAPGAAPDPVRDQADRPAGACRQRGQPLTRQGPRHRADRRQAGALIRTHTDQNR